MRRVAVCLLVASACAPGVVSEVTLDGSVAAHDSGAVQSDDAGFDAGLGDGGGGHGGGLGADAGVDAGATDDAGTRDAGVLDAGTADAGTADAGPFDAGGQHVPSAIGNAPWPLEVIGKVQDRAYPELAYDVRLSVIGGLYPYQFGLVTAPAGMTIDARKGIIRWTPSASTVGTTVSVQAKVTDSAGASVSHTYELRVTLADFLFVAPGGVDLSSVSGTKSEPFQTLGYAISRSNAASVIILREGTYLLSAGISLTDKNASIVQSYPGEQVTLDLGQTGRLSLTSNASTDVLRARAIQGLRIYNCLGKCIYNESAYNVVYRNNRFEHLVSQDVGENDSFIYFSGHNDPGPRHKNIRIQENSFTDFTTQKPGLSNQGISTWFDVHESLFEDNSAADLPAYGVTDKDNSYKNTFRTNSFENIGSGIFILGQAGAKSIHVHHNLLNASGLALCSSTANDCEDFYVHHNTVVNGSVNFISGFDDPTKNLQFNFNLIKTDIAFHASCGAPPTTLVTKLKSNHNLIDVSRLMLGNECPSNGTYTTTQWRSVTPAQDADSIFESVVLVGTGKNLGLPTTSPRFGVYGHQL